MEEYLKGMVKDNIYVVIFVSVIIIGCVVYKVISIGLYLSRFSDKSERIESLANGEHRYLLLNKVYFKVNLIKLTSSYDSKRPVLFNVLVIECPTGVEKTLVMQPDEITSNIVTLSKAELAKLKLLYGFQQ